jgi:hypothetical protein
MVHSGEQSPSSALLAKKHTVTIAEFGAAPVLGILIMKNKVEVYVYTEGDEEPKALNVSLEETVEELLKVVSPDRHHELCLIISGEGSPREKHHRLNECGIRRGHHLHIHSHHRSGRPHHERRVDVIVNGKPAEVRYVERELGSVLVERALEQTRNSGQKPENWELRTEEGVRLDQSQEVREYHLEKGAKLSLSLKAGGGGTGAKIR